MDVHDRLGRLQVGLLGTPKARHGGGEERAHAAVGDDDGPVVEALEEPAHERNASSRGLWGGIAPFQRVSRLLCICDVGG